jgi:hypothetical protein
MTALACLDRSIQRPEHPGPVGQLFGAKLKPSADPLNRSSVELHISQGRPGRLLPPHALHDERSATPTEAPLNASINGPIPSTARRTRLLALFLHHGPLRERGVAGAGSRKLPARTVSLWWSARSCYREDRSWSSVVPVSPSRPERSRDTRSRRSNKGADSATSSAHGHAAGARIDSAGPHQGLQSWQ